MKGFLNNKWKRYYFQRFVRITVIKWKKNMKMFESEKMYYLNDKIIKVNFKGSFHELLTRRCFHCAQLICFLLVHLQTWCTRFHSLDSMMHDLLHLQVSLEQLIWLLQVILQLEFNLYLQRRCQSFVLQEF